MSSGILFFSGAGNSRAVARTLGKELETDFCLRMADADEETLCRLKTLGLIFPSYFGAPPAYLRYFLSEVLRPAAPELEYLYLIITHGGGPMYSSGIAEMLLQDIGYAVSYVATLRMVDTYIPLFRVPPRAKQEAMNRKAFEDLHLIAEDIRNQKISIPPRWPLSRSAFTLFNRKKHSRYTKDRNFIVDERCTRCGVCAEVCPVGNITLEEKEGVTYHGSCEQCFACYHHCPTHAITLKRRPLHGYQYYQGPKHFNTGGVKP